MKYFDRLMVFCYSPTDQKHTLAELVTLIWPCEILAICPGHTPHSLTAGDEHQLPCNQLRKENEWMSESKAADHFIFKEQMKTNTTNLSNGFILNLSKYE